MPPLLRNVALVPDDNIPGAISLARLNKVAAALQKQATRDFGPVWDVSATVDAFASLDDVPLGYWPIIVGEENQHGGGVHLTHDNQPFALVDFTPDWTVTASHECLEMLADPFGNRLVAGDSPDPDNPGRVEFLVEVCDPCEVAALGYTVNGVRVSDFYTPRFFDPPQPAGAPSGGIRYDFMGRITEPRQVLRGGYLSWRQANGMWSQKLFFAAQPTFKNLGRFDRSFASLRAWIDSQTLDERKKLLKQRQAAAGQVLASVGDPYGDDNDLFDAATKECAQSLRAEIKAVRKK